MLYCKCHKINLNHSGTYIDSPDWIKNKKAMINLVNNDGKWFQDVAKIALNDEEIGKTPANNIKIKGFINKGN